MKHLKLFDNEINYNTWLSSDNYVTPYVSKNKNNGVMNYKKRIHYYDAELLYLESSGTQYIDTNIIPDKNTGALIQAIHYIDGHNDEYAIGVRNDNTDTRWCIGHKEKEWYCGYGNVVKPANGKPNILLDLVEIKLNYLNNIKLEIINLINNTYYVNNLSELSFTPLYPIRIFGTSGIVADYTQFHGKIYKVQITQGNEIILDLIPVRKNGVGYMFDTVSKQLYGNNGTGEFVLGPDK